MQAAERIVAGAGLRGALWGELQALQAAHPAGFMVRLHILGDFYSIDMSRSGRALAAFRRCHVFGFTAHPRGRSDRRGVERRWLGRLEPVRDPILRRGRRRTARVRGSARDPDAITCPAQTGKTECCATCALCWQSDRSISFIAH
jgi:hypothetical protein